VPDGVLDGDDHVEAPQRHVAHAELDGVAHLRRDDAEHAPAPPQAGEHRIDPRVGAQQIGVTAQVVLAVDGDELVRAGRVEALHLLPQRRADTGHEHVVGRHRAEHRAGSVAERVQYERDRVNQRAVEIEQPRLGRSGAGARDSSHTDQSDPRLGAYNAT
jgi:hypothetical protein